MSDKILSLQYFVRCFEQVVVVHFRRSYLYGILSDVSSELAPSVSDVTSPKARARAALERGQENAESKDEDGQEEEGEEDEEMPAGSKKVTIHVQSQQVTTPQRIENSLLKGYSQQVAVR